MGNLLLRRVSVDLAGIKSGIRKADVPDLERVLNRVCKDEKNALQH